MKIFKDWKSNFNNIKIHTTGYNTQVYGSDINNYTIIGNKTVDGYLIKKTEPETNISKLSLFIGGTRLYSNTYKLVKHKLSKYKLSKRKSPNIKHITRTRNKHITHTRNKHITRTRNKTYK